MEKIIKKGFVKAGIMWLIFLIFVIISSTKNIANSGFSGIMWLISFIIFAGAVILTVASWGAHLKTKLRK